jgi:hypothetical protein
LSIGEETEASIKWFRENKNTETPHSGKGGGIGYLWGIINVPESILSLA